MHHSTSKSYHGPLWVVPIQTVIGQAGAMYHGTSKSYHGLLQVYGFVPFRQVGTSPPSRSAGADFMSSSDEAFWSPQAPMLSTNVKPARSHSVTW